jgi:predicted dehydrogenase
MIDAAIIGLGWWGKTIVNAVQGKSDRLRFVRGVSKEPATVRDFAAQHRFDLSTELEEAVADPRVSAIVLATPHSLHPGQVAAVAAAGKPVFCEKPLALKKADALRAVEACRRAGVLLGIGTNKRFFPSMQELRRVVASGELGRLLHVEGNSSNANSNTLFAPWRELPSETPGAGMTGPGIHMLDALVSIGGPVRRVRTQVVVHKPAPEPLDAVSVLLEFRNDLSGSFAAVRASPLYWRVHVFGTAASVEALGETELVLHRPGHKPERRTLPAVNSVCAEIDAFADAVAGRAPYPISSSEMLDVVGAFEAIIQSIERDADAEVAA